MTTDSRLREAAKALVDYFDGLREPVVKMDGTERWNERHRLTNALRDALNEPATPVRPGERDAEIRESLEAVLQRAQCRRGMNTQELRGLLWGIEEIAQKALARLADARDAGGVERAKKEGIVLGLREAWYEMPWDRVRAQEWLVKRIAALRAGGGKPKDVAP